MAFLIDSDWTIDHLAENPTAQELLASLTSDGTYISIITYMEVFQGTLRGDNPTVRQARLDEFVQNSPVLHLTIPIAERCARLRQHFLDLGQRPARCGFDLLIAATALEYDLTLVTCNVRDYADIPDLRLYDRA